MKTKRAGRGREPEYVQPVVPEAVLRFAQGQRWLVTRAQAKELGASGATMHRLARAGSLDEVFPGVYRIGGAPEDYRQTLFAATLCGGPGSAVCGRAAAHLLGMGRLAETGVEILTPRNLHHVMGLGARRVRLRPDEITVVDGIPVTREVRTLLDLTPWSKFDDLCATIEDLWREKRLPDEQLQPLGRSHAPGAARLRAAVDAAHFSRVFALLRKLPPPDRVSVTYADGRRVVSERGRPRAVTVLPGGRKQAPTG